MVGLLPPAWLDQQTRPMESVPMPELYLPPPKVRKGAPRLRAPGVEASGPGLLGNPVCEGASQFGGPPVPGACSIANTPVPEIRRSSVPVAGPPWPWCRHWGLGPAGRGGTLAVPCRGPGPCAPSPAALLPGVTADTAYGRPEGWAGVATESVCRVPGPLGAPWDPARDWACGGRRDGLSWKRFNGACGLCAAST